jgi:hypothetical protein
VPEIADGLVEIRGVAREPGWSLEDRRRVHAQVSTSVGARASSRGSRAHGRSPSSAARRSTSSRGTPSRRASSRRRSPRARERSTSTTSRDATVVVPDDQLALAIGKEGLNARLAARLTGWKVDNVSDTEFAQQEAEAAFGGEGDVDFSGRCAAILANGKRCPNTALHGTRFCGVQAHQELAKIEAQTGEYAPGTVTPTTAEPEESDEEGDDAVQDTEAVTDQTLVQPVGCAVRAKAGRLLRNSRRSGRAPAAAAGRRSRSCAFRGRRRRVDAGTNAARRGAYTCARLLGFERAVPTGASTVLEQSVAVDPEALGRLYARTPYMANSPMTNQTPWRRGLAWHRVVIDQGGRRGGARAPGRGRQGQPAEQPRGDRRPDWAGDRSVRRHGPRLCGLGVPCRRVQSCEPRPGADCHAVALHGSQLIAAELKREVTINTSPRNEGEVFEDADADLVPRPPMITIVTASTTQDEPARRDSPDAVVRPRPAASRSTSAHIGSC